MTAGNVFAHKYMESIQFLVDFHLFPALVNNS